jgi:class 3 adenylate cyclase
VPVNLATGASALPSKENLSEHVEWVDMGQLPTLAWVSILSKRVWHRRPIGRTVCCSLDVRAMVQERPVRVERRLSAILAADVAGYSRLMHSDEEATHAKLTLLLADAVAPAITEHGGRIVKNTGDGFLAEFPSAVGAVRAA